MSSTVISIENLSKAYRLGQIGMGTLMDDLKVWWEIVRGRPHPFQIIGEEYSTNRETGMVWALRDIHLKVQQGEVLGIIGLNGAGKSTLLKIISKVTAPTNGEVKIKGRIGSLLEVGTGFHPDLTGRENIYLNGAILGMTKFEITTKFDEIVDFSGIEKYIDTPVKRYSSGMYVRLAFAVAAHLDAEILLVDEVLAVGDADFQKKCLGKMGDIAVKGRTVLFVSHNMMAASNLCDGAILLDQGKIELFDKVGKVIQTYLEKMVTQSSYPLEVRIDRQGNGRLRFMSLSIQNESQSEIKIVNPGQSIRLVLNYRAPALDELRNVSISADFYSALGVKIFTLATYISGGDFEKLPNHGVLICKIPQLLLLEGRYRVDLWASVNGEWADYVQGAGYIDVAPLNFLGGTTKLRGSKHGYFIIPHHWDLDEA